MSSAMQVLCVELPYESCTRLKVLVRAALRCQGRHQMGCQLTCIQLAALSKFFLLLVSILKLAICFCLHLPVMNIVAAYTCCCFAGQSGFSLTVIWQSFRNVISGHAA